ncbi:hypothetical protein CDCA_CDCA06G1806 [Cyanidium caldarium]|uniref:Nuclear condensin complex subunit 3 C-terminal domain-containing protein n=1 Tax=Cyanidium caldarium TaxID=2771 RepID=A0AAV9IUM7_CYACA|nr:hypothetical protein CDCA_CDCA06G1806 [Cyanidium caldarium]
MTAETPTDSTGQATVSRVERLVADALYDASRSFAAHVRARRLLAEAEAADPPAFVSALFSQLNRCLLVYAREPGVERVMALVASYAAATADAAHYGDQENHTAERDSFCSLLLGYVLSFSNAKDKAVRFRTCQLIALVLNALGEDAEISEALWSALSGALIERTRDRVPAVRAQAVAALCRLQNPDADDDDALLNGYVQWMTSDSSRAVRRAALLHAALLPGLPTLDAAVTRVRDVCSDVRRAALERVLAKKVDPRLLSIEQRVQIIEGGAHDRHRPVREACLQRLLLQAWLRGVCASNLVELLRMLDVEANEERLRDAVLQMLVECASSDWEAVVRTPAGNGETDAERALDWNALTPESAAALAWQTQAAVLRSRRSKQRPSPQPLDETDWAERLAPAAPDVAAALEYHMDQLRRMDSVEAAAGHGSAFIARMLLQTVCWLDATDEAGRRLLLPWLRAMLAEAQATPTETVVGAAMRALAHVLGDVDELVRLVVIEMEGEAEKEQGALHGLWRLQALLQVVLERSPRGRTRMPYTKTGAFALFHGSTVPLLLELVPRRLLPALASTAHAHRLAAMRCLGLVCLADASGACALQHLPLLLSACEHDAADVQRVALQTLFDVLCVFPLTATDKVTDADGSNAASGAWRAQVLQRLCSYLTDPPTEELRTVAVQGVCKLLFLRRIEPEPELLKRLLLLYVSPSTEEQPQLRQWLAVFFPAFCFASGQIGSEAVAAEHRDAIAQAFMPVLRVLVAAPPSSPLSAVSTTALADYFVFLASASSAARAQQSLQGDAAVHNRWEQQEACAAPDETLALRLALALLSELLCLAPERVSDMVAAEKTYGRILSRLPLSGRTASKAESSAEDADASSMQDDRAALQSLLRDALAQVRSTAARRDLERLAARWNGGLTTSAA